MKNLHQLFSILVMLCLCSVVLFTSVSAAMEGPEFNSMEESQTIIAGYPSFTQDDWDSGFTNYAADDSTVNLPSAINDTDRVSNAVGTVFDIDTDLPLPEAIITVNNLETDFTVTVMTDADGRFQIRGLTDGYYTWSISCEGYQPARYVGYDVCAGEINSIFTFYTSSSTPVERIYAHVPENLISDESFIPDGKLEESDDNNMSLRAVPSFSTPPALSSFTVGVNNSAKAIDRGAYLSAVVASEALGYYQCTDTYGMTSAQTKQYFVAQAVAASAFLEHAVNVDKKHSNYSVCDNSHCQTYDPTKTNQWTTDAVAYIQQNLGGKTSYYQMFYKNHHADRFAVCTNRDERVQTSSRLSCKIESRRKHTTTHGRMSRRLLPELKTV